MTSDMKMVFHNLTFHFQFIFLDLTHTVPSYICSILLSKSIIYHFNFNQNCKHSWGEMEGLLSNLIFLAMVIKQRRKQGDTRRGQGLKI